MDNPQSLNLYEYALNNPTTLPDLDGHLTPLGSCCGGGQAPVDPQQQEQQQIAQQTQGAATDQNKNTQDQGWSLSWQAQASKQFLKGELKGVADATVTPVIQTIEHPIQTVQGLANAVAHPVQTAENLANSAVSMAYKNSGGGGLNILNTPTKGSRIGLDIHGIPEAGGGVRPHIDVTIKKQGPLFGPKVSGPGSNLINIKHWPWN